MRRIKNISIKINKNIFIFLFMIILIHAYAIEKKPVFITGDNAKSRLVSTINGKKEYLTELTGNPVIKTGNKELRTDKIIVRGNNGNIAEAHGNVVLTDRTNGSKLRANKAAFFKEKNTIEFYGKPNALFKRDDDNSFINIQADKMKYDLNTSTAEATGKVKLINNDININSNKAVFKRDEGTAVFSQNPEIKRGDDVFNADEIIYNTNKKNIILNKNASIKAYSEEIDENTNRMNKIKMNVTGDRIDHFTEGITCTIVTGKARIERDDSVSTGDRFEMKGNKGNEELTGTDVHINYKDENMELYGKNLKSNRKEGISILWGNARIIIKDAKTNKETSRIFGDYMEHFRDIDELYISGNIRIVNSEGTIKGLMAKYTRKNNLLIVTGSARIVKNNSTVFASAITIDTKTSNTRLIGDIRGKGAR
ncbi:MAG: LPS export ABC transporter periplasmic protein LptC [Spirochaetes bacterium]|nr:LPS export ABC transporter periplasmic protein LptC [Spirochaetota bacterium]